jgi:ATP-binding cassette subfamily B protein
MEKKKVEKINFKDVGTIFGWYWRLSGQSRRWFMASLGFYALGEIMVNVVAVILFKRLVDAVIESPIGAVDNVWNLVFYLSLTFVIQYFFFQLGHSSMARYQTDSIESIARYCMESLSEHSYSFFSNRFAGALIAQSRRFVEGFYVITETITYTFWTGSISLIGIFSVVFYYSWQIGLLLLVLLTGIGFIVTPFVRRRMEVDEEESQANSRLSGYMSDVISNILTTKIFPEREYERETFGKYLDQQVAMLRASWKVFNRLSNVQNGLVQCMRVLILIAGVYLWQEGRITAGTIVLLLTYSWTIFQITWNMVRSTSGFLKAVANAREMTAIFETISDVQDPESPEECRITKGAIEFREVGFHYQDGGKVFEQLNLTIAPGEHVGLVGPSGGGKSTITKLLLRFMDPTEGRVLIDGQDIRMLRQDDLRHSIAYVPQDPTLFHRTLRENIAYGRADASEEEIIDAAKKAHAHEFIETLEKGYDTMVGERGIKLSGGQRQRIAIARAILKDAPILVLDEATSALDTVSEFAIRGAVDELIKSKTAIIIAHRLSTVEKMDRIIVLDKNGTISEEGTHQKLVTQNGLYGELWSHQTGGFLPEDEDAETKKEENVGD